jgi:phosphoribosylaminoimidazole-succinocarboxamide synthase
LGGVSGSAWAEYKKSGTVHGIHMPQGLLESQKLPEPLFTPSTKAEQGKHDENISPDQGAYDEHFSCHLEITLRM